MKIKLIILLLLCSCLLMAKSRYSGYSVLTFLHTDRYCYITGDDVFLKAYHIIDEEALNGKETAIYIDLVDSKNTFITGEILPLEKGMAQGYLSIPDSLKTGNYFLRVYTDHSTAFSNQEILDKKHIFISNRFGRKGDENDKNTSLEVNDSLKSYQLEEKLVSNVKLELSDSIYNRRSLVQIKVKSQVLDILSSSLSVKSISEYEYRMTLKNKQDFEPQYAESIGGIETISFNEEKGMVVSGLARHSVTGKPLEGVLILLAVEDTLLQLKYSLTNDKGEFFFLMNNFIGKQTVFLSCYTYPEMYLYKQADLTIKDKFLDEDQLQSSEIKGYIGSNDTLNQAKAIVAKAYGISPIEYQELKAKEESFESRFLAGELADVVDMDDYIELPDFTELSKEILPFVRFKNTNDGYRFYLFDGENRLVKDNPMVFVDGVPLTDYSAIASWGTEKIDRVEVQNRQRYYGDVPFEDGFLFIWTKGLTFWDRREIAYTSITELNGFQQPVTYVFPNYGASQKDNIPDFRQTLYWEPKLPTEKGGERMVEFYTSDETGIFEINFVGVLEDNQPFHIRKYIQVN